MRTMTSRNDLVVLPLSTLACLTALLRLLTVTLLWLSVLLSIATVSLLLLLTITSISALLAVLTISLLLTVSVTELLLPLLTTKPLLASSCTVLVPHRIIHCQRASVEFKTSHFSFCFFSFLG